MKFTRRKVRLLLVTTVVVLAGIVGFIWLAAGELVHPARRELQDYHHEWLEHSAAHGIAVTKFDALQGKAPCLMVEPDATHGPGDRGTLLRKQLTERGWQLGDYGTIRGTLVLLHGREGRKEDLLPVAERFVAAGFRCIMPDLPCHGDSPIDTVYFGSSPFECGLAASALKEAAAKYHFPDAPAGVWGMSMGGSFAISAAANDPQQWKAMVLVCTFDTLSGVENDKLHKWFGPLGPYLAPATDIAIVAHDGVPGGAVRPIEKARGITIPTLVAHGNDDALIYLKRGKRLFNAFPGPDKKWIEVNGATHGTILVTKQPIYAEMSEWYLQWIDPAAKHSPAPGS